MTSDDQAGADGPPPEDDLPEARLGRGFFSPPPEAAPAPDAPSYEYPASGSGFYTAALEALEVADIEAAAEPEDAGDISQLFGMLEDASPEVPSAPAPLPPPVATPALPPPIAVAPPVEPAPPPPVAPPLAPPAPEPVAAYPPPPAPVPAYEPPPPAYQPPPPAYEPPPPAPEQAAPAEVTPAAAPAPVRLPVAEAHCAMCGMTVPIDTARGRCHLGHALTAARGSGRPGRRG